MPEFVPILLLALASLTALYLGFVLQSQIVESPAGFIPVNAKQVQARQEPAATGAAFFSPPKKASDIIFLGDVVEISAGEPEKLLELSEKIIAKDSEAQRSLLFSTEKKYDQLFLKFFVSETNSHGGFSVFINGEKVYSGRPKTGLHQIQIYKDLLKEENEIRVEASGGFLFTPAEYAFELELIGVTGTHAFYHFHSSDASERIFETSVFGDGSFRALLNGEEIYNGGPSDFISVPVVKGFASGKNILEIFPAPGSDLRIEFVEFIKN